MGNTTRTPQQQIKAHIVGRLGSEWEAKGQRGSMKASIGVTPRRKNAQTGEWEDGETTWFTAWANDASSTGQASKGDLVEVHGNLRHRLYEGKVYLDLGNAEVTVLRRKGESAGTVSFASKYDDDDIGF